MTGLFQREWLCAPVAPSGQDCERADGTACVQMDEAKAVQSWADTRVGLTETCTHSHDAHSLGSADAPSS